MAFDWVTFLHRHNVEFISGGANTASNNISIRCPFCGADDPSFHLGISLEGKGWNCWRRSEHRGKSPVKLIMALAGCSYEDARQIAGYQHSIPDDFMGSIRSLMAKPEDTPKRTLELPREFKCFDWGKPSFKMYANYLMSKKRKFSARQIDWMADMFDLRYCTQGPYRGRIIFPVHFEGQLVSWSGRSVYDSELVRYKTLTTKPEKAEKEGTDLAIGPITEYLLWFDELMDYGGEVLFLVEGPFDALKINVLGWKYGIAATCLFTNRIRDRQIDLLHSLAPRFDRRYILLDEGMLAEMAFGHIEKELTSLEFRGLNLPAGVKDPGIITKPDLLDLARISP